MRICVFCGSGSGRDPRYVEHARAFGSLLAQRGIGLVYGGATIGTMGAVADAVLAVGGEVYGVIPAALDKHEIGHRGVTELFVVDSMHQRKAKMAELADAFVALPGGIGTLEELFEVWTWRQLGIYDKPCGLLNVLGFYDRLLSFLDHVQSEGFFRTGREELTVEKDAAALIDRLLALANEPKRASAMLGPDQT